MVMATYDGDEGKYEDGGDYDGDCDGDWDGDGYDDDDKYGEDEDEYGDVWQQLMRQGGDNSTAVTIETGIDNDYEAVRCSS